MAKFFKGIYVESPISKSTKTESQKGRYILVCKNSTLVLFQSFNSLVFPINHEFRKWKKLQVLNIERIYQIIILSGSHIDRHIQKLICYIKKFWLKNLVVFKNLQTNVF